MTRVPDASIDELRNVGFARVDGFLTDAELTAIAEPLAAEVPSREAYHATPERYTHLVETQFSGNFKFPYSQMELNRLAYHPDLIDAAERFHGTTDIDLYKVELWAKYSGAVDYEQRLHRDYGNHTMLVPRTDGAWPQMTTILLLSDVTKKDGPTMAVPLSASQSIPMHVRLALRREYPALYLAQVPLVGPAGTLYIYRTDVFHRGSSMKGNERARFIYMADYKARGTSWQGKIAWPDSAINEHWGPVLADATPRQREVFGIPAPGHEYWNEQTVTDVQGRWPGWDMTPYREAMAKQS